MDSHVSNPKSETDPQFRTYRGSTLRDALAKVRRDLGGGAVILETREIHRRQLLGLGTRELVEVTAIDGKEPLVRPSASRSKGESETEIESASSTNTHLHLQIGEQLGRLHEVVEGLSKLGRLDHLLPDLPTDLVPTYARLLEADVAEPLARRLVRQVADWIEPDEARSPEAIFEALAAAVEDCLPIAPPIAALPGLRRVVALVGPTGVGKTTTVAKLAADAKLTRGLRVGLVTMDTYRISAIEQLRTYAEIIDLPLAVADSPSNMRTAIDDVGEVDLVLIDTAGRSPRDEPKIRELADFLVEAHPDEIHLVLSAGAGERSLSSAIERFANVQADRLILTKLDEAENAGLGHLLAAILRSNRPVSYLTTGQAVPDDIEPANRRRLTRLILGQEDLFKPPRSRIA